ncbi:MAG: TonB-dependent receptor plug domain-containing protein [Campylobacteraceae bacterium]|jgi:hypothetical protein|nr:TonB-dependent receptor plug domain-containing protein [Campylobacteraceae bacterium]
MILLSVKIKKAFVFFFIVCSNVTIFAQTYIENNSTSSNNETLTSLQEITIKSSKNITWFSLIDDKKIINIPTPTNSVTDTLRSKSNIQFSSNSRSSAQGGEITPPKVSIRGSQHYENNFIINGISNNNNLNPGGLEPNQNIVGLPASLEAQSIFLDTSLVKSITTHTEAISAEYGGFTGGVVDAKLKDARMDKWHFVARYRYTADNLAKFHLIDKQKDINKSTSADYQPEFSKHEYTVSLDGPINDNLGLMLSCGKQYSKIPLWGNYEIYNSNTNSYYKERQIGYRTNENFLIKLNVHDIDDFEASLTTIYAPYTSSRFVLYKNSDTDVKGGGLNIAYDMKNILNFGLLKSTLAYKQDEATTDAKTDKYHQWIHIPNGYAKWKHPTSNYSYEGALGDRELTKQSFIYKSVFDFDEIQIKNFEHTIKAGIEAEFGKARYKREKGEVLNDAVLNASTVGSKDDGIIEGEQWNSRNQVRMPLDNKKSYTTAALFFEDTIKVDRYTIRPGIRLSIDTVTNNKDIAPRLFVNADIFDDKTLNVYGGYNRYYGGLILYNAIYEYYAKVYKRDSFDKPWYDTNSTTHQTYSLDGIKTPYSDEFSIGSSLSYQDTLFKFDFAKREYKDQIKQSRSGSSFFNTNDGRSSYWGLTLTVSREYKIGTTKHFSELSATSSEVKSNMMGLNSFSSDESVSPDYVTYNGKLTKLTDIPSANYNSPLVITYNHITELSDYLKLGLNARYEKGVNGFKWKSNGGGLKDPDNLSTRVYESKYYKDIFTIDLSANYDIKARGNKLTFGLEILNLLNRKNDASYTESSSYIDGYAMGRQFYVNFKYEY